MSDADVPTLLANLTPGSPAATPPPEIVRIRPSAGWRALNLFELWRYRELLWFLALRDIKLRYKQTALGVAWAVLQPLMSVVVFSIFFGVLAKVPSDGFPYPLFALTAMVPWQFFSYALTQSSNSLVNEQRLITKVYFPRLVVPIASVLSGLVDLVVVFIMVLLPGDGVVHVVGRVNSRGVGRRHPGGAAPRAVRAGDRACRRTLAGRG